MPKYINLTPHSIRLNNGTEFPASGTVARVTATYTPFDENGVSEVKFGEPIGLPPLIDGVILIVSGMLAQASKRADLVSPATGHPDCIRKDGQVISVPGFVRA
ncbi:MAG: hypothetical protein RLZZ67_18 [Candidatus Parcubacteria bacterium]|jgi:hypothetical protein